MERLYDSDLSDAEWALIAHHFEPRDPRGIKPIHPKRTIVNAILYLNKTGAQWRLLPKDYPLSVIVEFEGFGSTFDHFGRGEKKKPP